jgi:hypothetical protein
MKNTIVDAKQFLKSAVHVEPRFVYELPETHTYEDITAPEYWRSVAEKLPRLTVVTCLGGADNLDIDLRCLGSSQGYCVMRVIREMPATKSGASTPEAAEPRVEYRPGSKWCAVDRLGAVIKGGLSSRSEAEEALANSTGK